MAPWTALTATVDRAPDICKALAPEHRERQGLVLAPKQVGTQVLFAKVALTGAQLLGQGEEQRTVGTSSLSDPVWSGHRGGIEAAPLILFEDLVCFLQHYVEMIKMLVDVSV